MEHQTRADRPIQMIKLLVLQSDKTLSPLEIFSSLIWVTHSLKLSSNLHCRRSSIKIVTSPQRNSKLQRESFLVKVSKNASKLLCSSVSKANKALFLLI